MPRTALIPVKVLKKIKARDRWILCQAIQEPNGRYNDRVRVEGKIETHAEGHYYLEWREGGQRRREAISSRSQVLDRVRIKTLELGAASAGMSLTPASTADSNSVSAPASFTSADGVAAVAQHILSGLGLYLQQLAGGTFANSGPAIPPVQLPLAMASAGLMPTPPPSTVAELTPSRSAMSTIEYPRSVASPTPEPGLPSPVVAKLLPAALTPKDRMAEDAQHAPVEPAVSHVPVKEAELAPTASVDGPKESLTIAGTIASFLKDVEPPQREWKTYEEYRNDGQLTLDDIKRMRSPDSSASAEQAKYAPNTPSSPHGNDSLAAVPSFADTQQKWEEPRPYGENQAGRTANVQQEQALLKETSIVFVRTQTQSQTTSNSSTGLGGTDELFLDVTPGSRILAKLKTEISSADATLVVAQVEYTYAIGDQTVLPAGAEIYGHIQQADRVGNVSVKFEEVDLLDGRREKIEAVGKGLDMGPIKGKVYGKNTGKNLLVRSVSGIGSTMAMVFGNNTSSAFSEDDLIRERLAENIGTAGDSEIMNMALNSREYVSVPAETRIYIVFTKHEESSSALHKVNP